MFKLFFVVVVVKQEKKKIPLSNGFIDPREEIDHDAIKLAQEFERKYGNAYAGSDSRSSKGMANADKGSGYDENNGFIDDSEAVSNILTEKKYFCSFLKLLILFIRFYSMMK